MNHPNTHQTILNALAQLEAERKIRILFACESGSRAWGFPSQDSDYDVRFLYVHEREWYLSVEDQRDVIELPLSANLDLSGWELRKALRLLRKSNPPLLEWLNSPIVYRRDPRFMADFSALSTEFYSPKQAFLHYLNMAQGNWRQYVLGRDQVLAKKYLYVFRPLLAARWIERGFGQVPVPFAELLERTLEHGPTRTALEALVAEKKTGAELDLRPALPLFTRFLSDELARLSTVSEPAHPTGDPEVLNRFFRRHLPAASAAPPQTLSLYS